MEKHTGVVKWFNDKKGFGFITDDATGRDVFVHYKHIISNESRKKLDQDDRVEFNIETNEKGNIATNVQKFS